MGDRILNWFMDHCASWVVIIILGMAAVLGWLFIGLLVAWALYEI